VAADADNGKRLAEMRCVPCHVLVANPRREVSDAPPFQAIARKFAAAPEMLAFAMLHPHPRMNVTLTRREVEDIPRISIHLLDSRQRASIAHVFANRAGQECHGPHRMR
jgi:hypothetical protein